MRKSIAVAALLMAPAAAIAQAPPTAANEAFRKVCGACHSVETVTNQRRTREQWRENIDAMIFRGAKGTSEEFAMILDLLTAQYSPATPPAVPTAAAARVPPRNDPAYSPGSADKHVVDENAANRGRKVYAAECITCHGTHARGSERGADLVRSELVLHDRYGNLLGPFLRKGHTTQTTPSSQLTSAQIEDLSHTIHQELYNTLRAALQIQNVLTGDAKAGAQYFNGAGRCATCHSPTGDLAHIATRLEPAQLQQRFLFPGGRGGKPVTVTVQPSSGAPVIGQLVHLDDFNVALRDNAGEYRSFNRTPALKVVKNDPAQPHHELLEQYTDQNIHDVVAYLETLK